jgi:hypothetical protein
MNSAWPRRIAAVASLATMCVAAHAQQPAKNYTPSEADAVRNNLPLDRSRPVALNLNDKQRQAVLDAVAREDTHQATPKDFRAEVGAKIGAGVNLHALPRPLVYEIPRLKEYTYANLDRNIVIIDPLAKHVVEVIPLPPDLAYSGGSSKTKVENVVGGLPSVDQAQLRMIYQKIPDIGAQPAPSGQTMMAGAAAPATLTLSAVPPEIGTEVPALSGTLYARLNDGRLVFVDPAQRKVVGIITRDEGTRLANENNANGTDAQGSNSGVGTQSGTRDPLKAREESGKPSAYTGPSTTGPNTDGK